MQHVFAPVLRSDLNVAVRVMLSGGATACGLCTKYSVPAPIVTPILRTGQRFDSDSLLDEPRNVSLTQIQ